MKKILLTLVAVASLMGLTPVFADTPCQENAHDQSSCTTGPGQKALTAFYTLGGDSNADVPQNPDIPQMPSAGGGGTVERDTISQASPILGEMDTIVYALMAILFIVFVAILIPILRRTRRRY